jgi:hypothetical protein
VAGDALEEAHERADFGVQVAALEADRAAGGSDIQPFVNILLSGDRSSPAFCAADMDQSGEVSTDDVPLFTSAILN